MNQVPTQFSSDKTTSLGKCYFLQANTTTILLACIRSLKSSTEMKINKRMFFARGDTLCNDTTELSLVEFHKILSAAFVVPALKPQKSWNRYGAKDNFYVAMPPRHLWKSIG